MKKWLFFLILFQTVVYGQTIETFVGNGTNGCSVAGGPALSSGLSGPLGCIFDRHGNFYFANQQCQTVCKVNASGIITTIAGTGILGFSGDGGAAISAKLNYPNDVALDSSGNLYIVDGMNYRIRKVNLSTGTISTVAGTGVAGYSGDGGHATAAQFSGINGICFDNDNNMYISDANNHRIRKIDAVTNVISTFCGTGTAGFSGDGMPATSAQINTPFDLAVDNMGNIYFPDANNKRIRKVNSSGIITTIAGTGIALYSVDGGPATNSNVGAYKIAVDNAGSIYVSDSNQRIRKINSSGIISTVAGTGIQGYSGDGGLATAAQIASPSGVAIDLCGNVYFGDVGNYRIRKVTMPPVLTIPAITVAVPGESGPIPIGTTVTVTAAVSNAGSSYLIRWMNRGIEFATTTVPTVTYTKGPGTDTITAKVVSTATYGCYDSTTSAPHYVHEGTVGVLYLQTAGIMVYPNPAGNNVTISTTIPITSVCITNVLGQVVQVAPPGLPQGEVTAPPILPRGEVTVPVGHLPKGVYVVRINGLYVQRLVKE